MVKRVNAAVVVNNQSVTDDKGKTTSTPLTDAQLEKMTALVREAVGFSKDRGDSVNLVNAAFVQSKEEAVEIPIWRQPEVIEVARSFAWPLGTLALAAMVFFGAIKPALKNMGTTAVALPGEAAGSSGQLDALESETLERPQLALSSPQEQAQTSAAEQRLEDARKLTRDNPAAVANIVKAWMNGEAPAV
jgi:flagellar M-ring protein FliF